MQGYPPNQPPPGGGYPPAGPPPGSPYGYGAPPPGAPGGPGGYGGPMMNPQAPYGVDPATGLALSDKSKIAAGLLQFFVPGVGRIYTGHVGIGIAQMAVTLLTCLGVIWPIVDGVMMLTGRVTDAQGRPLRE
jgi:hypothetical protein